MIFFSLTGTFDVTDIQYSVDANTGETVCIM